MTQLLRRVLLATTFLAPTNVMAEQPADSMAVNQASVNEHARLELWRSTDVNNPFLGYLIGYVDDGNTEAQFLTCNCKVVVSKMDKVVNISDYSEVCPNGSPRLISLYRILEDNSAREAISGVWNGNQAKITEISPYQSSARTFLGIMAKVEDGANELGEVWIPERNVGFAAVRETGSVVSNLIIGPKDLSIYASDLPRGVESASEEALRAHSVLECNS